MSASVDRAVTIVASVAAPVLSLLVHEHVLSSLAATDIGSIVATAVASFHGGKAVQRRDNVASTPAHAPTTGV